MFEIKIPTSAGEYQVSAKPGETLVFLGPNGSGKSRLGVMIEGGHLAVHRIGGHRALQLNTKIQPPNLETALNRLSYGHEQHPGNRVTFRWQNKPAIALLSDFDPLRRRERNFGSASTSAYEGFNDRAASDQAGSSQGNLGLFIAPSRTNYPCRRHKS
ncbi:MAG: ATP-binding cassette domain-containing protein [Mesorhizobium sp.]|nr:MAG: ATP-binding cassette domain-containing protein [Mesorhizobium sp.]